MAVVGMILCSLFLVGVWSSEIQAKLSHWKSRR
jgi:hypothetical protein